MAICAQCHLATRYRTRSLPYSRGLMQSARIRAINTHSRRDRQLQVAVCQGQGCQEFEAQKLAMHGGMAISALCVRGSYISLLAVIGSAGYPFEHCVCST